MTQAPSKTVEGRMAERGHVPQLAPMVSDNPDGDWIECLLENEPFYARRLDGWVTVHCGEETGEVAGCFIKGVKTSLLPRLTGLNVDVEGGAVRLVLLLRASAWQTADQVRQAAYKAMIQRAEEADIRAELEPVSR